MENLNFKKLIFSFIIIFSFLINPLLSSKFRANSLYRIDKNSPDRISFTEHSTYKPCICTLQRNSASNILFKIEKHFSKALYDNPSELIYSFVFSANTAILILFSLFCFYKVLINYKFLRVTLFYQTVR